jgi:hypothetical protein
VRISAKLQVPHWVSEHELATKTLRAFDGFKLLVTVKRPRQQIEGAFAEQVIFKAAPFYFFTWRFPMEGSLKAESDSCCDVASTSPLLPSRCRRMLTTLRSHALKRR